MRLAVEEAHKGEGKTSPYPSVGCVVVKAGRVVARGFTQAKGREHAEVNALKKIGERARGATLYSTLEPCHHNDYADCEPCDQWILKSKIRTVVWGAGDPNPKNQQGSTRWFARQKIRVVPRVLEKDCRKLHEIFLTSLVKKRPFTFLCTGVTLDGKITWKKDAPPVRFSSEAALRKVHELRSRADAICAGIRTLEIDNPRLTARVRGARNPHRIVIDSKCRLSANAKIFEPIDSKVYVITTPYAPLARRQELIDRGAEIIVVPETIQGRVDLVSGFKALYQRGITSVMIEGGGELVASALKAKLVDKLYYLYAPMLVGGRDTTSPVEGDGLKRFSDAVRVRDIGIEHLGDDILVEGYTQY